MSIHFVIHTAAHTHSIHIPSLSHETTDVRALSSFLQQSKKNKLLI